MPTDLLTVIGEPFEKLLKTKQKPIFLNQTINQKKFPFLDQFRLGLKTFAPLEQGIIEEISEDPTETLYFLSLLNEGIDYTIIVSEKEDCWIIREIRVNKQGLAAAGSPHTGKKRKQGLSLPLLFLIVISAAGYFYQYGISKQGKNDNPTLSELYSPQHASESKQQVKASGTTGAAPSAPVRASAGTSAGTPASWEQEKADLEKQVAALKKENEALRKQVSAIQKPAH
jgi:hypothetical protein